MPNLNPKARTIVKHMVNNILFDAAMGKYDENYYGSSYSSSRPASSFHSECTVSTAEEGQEETSVFGVLTEFLNMDKMSNK